MSTTKKNNPSSLAEDVAKKLKVETDWSDRMIHTAVKLRYPSESQRTTYRSFLPFFKQYYNIEISADAIRKQVDNFIKVDLQSDKKDPNLFSLINNFIKENHDADAVLYKPKCKTEAKEQESGYKDDKHDEDNGSGSKVPTSQPQVPLNKKDLRELFIEGDEENVKLLGDILDNINESKRLVQKRAFEGLKNSFGPFEESEDYNFIKKSNLEDFLKGKLNNILEKPEIAEYTGKWNTLLKRF